MRLFHQYQFAYSLNTVAYDQKSMTTAAQWRDNKFWCPTHLSDGVGGPGT